MEDFGIERLTKEGVEQKIEVILDDFDTCIVTKDINEAEDGLSKCVRVDFNSRENAKEAEQVLKSKGIDVTIGEGVNSKCLSIKYEKSN
jgi:hypothetical protein